MSARFFLKKSPTKLECTRLSHERVALIGRNGVGKSTLLNILSGEKLPDSGKVVLRTKPYMVKQLPGRRPNPAEIEKLLHRLQQTSLRKNGLADELCRAGLKPLHRLLQERSLSHGEFRKLKLLTGKALRPKILLLDEPTQDMDEKGIEWLKEWLPHWPYALIAATHDRDMLKLFNNFFIVSETGSYCFSGALEALENKLECDHKNIQARYIQDLNKLIKQEQHIAHITRRRKRKKQYGRISEIGRATPKICLNQKRDYAQVKHGKMKKIREARLGAIRDWTKRTRRMLQVELPLLLPPPVPPPPENTPLITLKDVSIEMKGGFLIQRMTMEINRERIAIIGPNGAGKTTLLEIMLGRRSPSSGRVRVDYKRIGFIPQDGKDWEVDETLLSRLRMCSSASTPVELGEILISHKFPLALGQRPLSSLSPGERVRAAFICLYHRSPPAELLILDEPTRNLDLFGQKALTIALKAWPGGLVVASHNRRFLSDIGIERKIEI